MDNVVKEENKKKNVIIGVLIILLLIVTGFICYDKLLKKGETESKNCNCPICEKCKDEDKQDSKLNVCTLDMSGKTNIDVQDECMKINEDGYDDVVVKNIKVNGKTYELKYIHKLDESTDDDQLSYDNSVTMVYVNGELLDAYPGMYRNVLMTLRIENNKLILGETFPSDVPPADHSYDLN